MSKGLKVLGRISAGALVAAAIATIAMPVAAQDIVAVGNATGVKGTRVNIPLQVKDAPATILGVDQAVTANVSGRIANISITVDYDPALGSVATAYDNAFPGVASGIATGIAQFSAAEVLTNPGVFPNRFNYQVTYQSNGAGGPQIPFNTASATPETIAVVPFLIPAGTPNGNYVFTVNTGPATTLVSLDTTVELVSPALGTLNGILTVTPVELQAFDAE